jgi:SAM-dependent methyltransferase
MEAREYDKMAEVEDSMWWYRGLHGNLLHVLERFLPGPSARVLDAGCGTGGLLRILSSAGVAGRAFGLDAWQPACRVAADRSRQPVVRGAVDRLPFRDGQIDCLVSADVLCHQSVDPRLALREARRCLKPGGLIVLNLPAYAWLISYHDERLKQTRRFTRGDLKRLFEETGYSPVYATYWNTVLFPLMALRRLLFRSSAKESDVHPYPPLAESFFGALMAGERALLRRGVRLPFGGSVLAVGRKRDA